MILRVISVLFKMEAVSVRFCTTGHVTVCVGMVEAAFLTGATTQVRAVNTKKKLGTDDRVCVSVD